jgi:hypothetical protein
MKTAGHSSSKIASYSLLPYPEKHRSSTDKFRQFNPILDWVYWQKSDTCQLETNLPVNNHKRSIDFPIPD